MTMREEYQEPSKESQTRRPYEEVQRGWQGQMRYVVVLRDLGRLLAKEPIMVGSGQYVDKYGQPRPYADVQNEIMTQLANLARGKKGVARCKLPQGECTIQTIKPPAVEESPAVLARIQRIIQRSREEYCRKRTEVEEEIRARQERESHEVPFTAQPTQQILPQPEETGDAPAFPLRRNVSLE